MATDSTILNDEIAEIVPKALGEYLLNNVSGLREFYDEFPSANNAFTTPSVSVIVSTDDFRAIANKQPLTPPVAPSPPTGSGEDQEPQQVHWVVGFRDFTIQLDIWAGSKEERDDLVGAVFNAMNPKIDPSGLVLNLDEYFNQLCDYLVINRNNGDTEQSSQTGEWRSTWTILASCKSIQTRQEFVIENTDLDAEFFNTAEPIN